MTNDSTNQSQNVVTLSVSPPKLFSFLCTYSFLLHLMNNQPSPHVFVVFPLECCIWKMRAESTFSNLLYIKVLFEFLKEVAATSLMSKRKTGPHLKFTLEWKMNIIYHSLSTWKTMQEPFLVSRGSSNIVWTGYDSAWRTTAPPLGLQK